MKNKYLIAVLASLIVCCNLQAQKISDDKVTFKFKRLPSQFLGKEFTNYTSNVVLAYADEEEKKMAEYEKQVLKAEAEYQAELTRWEAEDAKAEQEYQQALEEYNKKSLGKKLVDKELLDQGKPQRRTPSKPYKNLPQKPVTQKTLDKDLLATTYIKLEGFNRNPENAVVVTVTLYGFEHIQPELKSTKRTMTNSDKTTREVTYYYYETSYKHAMSVKVEVPGKGVVMNESMTKMAEYTVEKTAEKEGQSYMNIESYVKGLEEKILAKNMKEVNDLVNDRFGYVTTDRTIKLYSITSKKENYDDYKEAFDEASAGFRKLTENPEQAMAHLKKAVANWEKALTESDPENKKARIGEDETEVTIINLIEAYIWLNDYESAAKHLDQFKKMDGSKKQKKYVDALDEFMKDQKARYEATK